MEYIDIGLNLFCRQFPRPDSIITDALRAGVACILTGSDMDENLKIHKYAQNHPVLGTCGIHPHNADHFRSNDLETMRDILVQNPRIVAVGETGLDYNRMFSTKENQIRNLEEHIELAESLGKPMFLHEREASHDLIEIFRQHPSLPEHCVIHCFTGTRHELETYLDMGFMIGITGWICDDRRGGALRDAVSILPLERVMLETDAPYLTPKNVSGLDRVNKPENIHYVAQSLAQFMNCSMDALKEAALSNTFRFFQISSEMFEQEGAAMTP